MYKRIITGLSLLIGLSFGVTVGPSIWHGIPNVPSWTSNIYLNGFIFMIIFMILGSLLSPVIERVIRYLIEWMNNLTTLNLILGTIGTLIGLLIGFLLSLPFNSLNIPFVSSTLPLIFSITLALVGYQTVMSRKEEWRKLFSRSLNKSTIETKESQLIELATSDNMYKYKLLDTSVIIDSRIADIVQTNFIEGTLVIPNFVLQELQFIADSSDALKRAKGRRGLDTLNALQKDGYIPIEFYEGDFDDITEVDSKLIRLAKLMNAAILTNDYNLNKVCEFQNVTVFNINELANAVKPVVIPGEEMHVQVIKSGTERKQGVAYLDDGTMIVVEDGQNHMNEWIDVVVTSALQTAAGRMIFAKPIE
ncbi:MULTISPECIES: PIN/TRAM domain-containing protein [unclassified Facklamia]|uniref:PIN/TRAM domain-containing protein n=1 Tax=Aerococcaceae TaxID=186827 RepID=UPI0013BDB65B|nr:MULTISPECIES: PIN/TRAM domain-containing protein [unclassified Facklamia]NEW64994.1 PIN domain nuclease [Facklamia sp. 252]NEW68455.1 PIN domain nuclease [Facklamia sp. 253]QQD65592.1 PIN/TRAM domain-containing protein [Aerococcaceae bacterium zg-252]